jgi:hypothetical protein
MMLIFLCLLSIRSWLDTNFSRRGHHRQVNAILGNLLRLHYLRLVARGAGCTAPATTWCDYARALDARYENVQRVMRNAFWVSSFSLLHSSSYVFCSRFVTLTINPNTIDEMFTSVQMDTIFHNTHKKISYPER